MYELGTKAKLRRAGELFAILSFNCKPSISNVGRSSLFVGERGRDGEGFGVQFTDDP